MKNYPFTFLGDEIALDLTNTEIMARGKRRDLLGTPDDLARWWGEALRRHPDISTPSIAFDVHMLDAIQDLRSALRRLFMAVIRRDRPAEADLLAVNRVLANASPALRLDSTGHVIGSYESHDGALAHVLATLALSAYRQLTDYSPERLRKCGNERCTMLFYDHTRSATRRWCSTACMNRMRSAERYKLARQTQRA